MRSLLDAAKRLKKDNIPSGVREDSRGFILISGEGFCFLVYFEFWCFAALNVVFVGRAKRPPEMAEIASFGHLASGDGFCRRIGQVSRVSSFNGAEEGVIV
ncbi:hypothetical protein SUGI_1131720 [Cryptomeria japonica]|nr:hypothetical protein SUGI_1131720 [Cryptomeria japonica]